MCEKNNKISIIIPVYNSEKYLEKCLKSVINQTYKNLEIIIVNDGSTDKSIEICKKIKERDNRILILDLQNGGVSYARNNGIKIATGAYIGFVDSDDYLKEDFVEKLYNGTDNGRNDMVICGYTCFDGSKKEENKKNIEEKLYEKEDFLEDFVKLKNAGMINTPWNKLTKSEIVKKYEFNEHYVNGEDYLFNLDLLSESKKIKTINSCSYMYRDNESGVTHKIKVSYNSHCELDNMLSILEIEKNKLIKVGISDNEINELFSNKAFSIFKYVTRNIAFNPVNKKEKDKKYKNLIKNTTLKELVYKKKIDSKKDIVIVWIYKTQNLFLLKIYAFFLKNKHK